MWIDQIVLRTLRDTQVILHKSSIATFYATFHRALFTVLILALLASEGICVAVIVFGAFGQALIQIEVESVLFLGTRQTNQGGGTSGTGVPAWGALALQRVGVMGAWTGRQTGVLI